MICSPVSDRGGRRASDPPRRAGGSRSPPSPRRPWTSARRRTPSPAPAGRAARSAPACRLAASTSPARVSRSFATAPMSPGPSSSIGVISLPSGAASWPIRSFSPRTTFWTWESELQHAGVDAQHVDPARVGVGGGLEHVGEQVARLVGLDLDRLAVARRARSSPRASPARAGPRPAPRAAGWCRGSWSRPRR